MRFLLILVYHLPVFVVATALARLVPKRSDLVLILARSDGTFSDNAKYVYFALERDPRLDVRFLTYNRQERQVLDGAGIRSVVFPTLAGLRVCLRARVTIGSGYFGFRGAVGRLVSRSSRFQLWHGAGIKNVALDAPQLVRRRKRPFYGLFLRWSGRFPVFSRMYFPSKAAMRRRSETFRYEKAALNGFVRNDLLFGKRFGGREYLGTDNECGKRMRSARLAGRRVLLFAPTWRSLSRPSLGSRVPFDLRALEAVLSASDAVLVIKLHKAMLDSFDLSDCPHIVEYARERDIYPYLRDADLMISDFSSIVTDFALSGRPIILYVPDYEALFREARFSAADFELLMGWRSKDMPDLLEKVRVFLGSPVPPAEAYPQLSEFHDFRDAGSGERLLRDVLAEIGFSGDHLPL